jgi:hypothetical protein
MTFMRNLARGAPRDAYGPRAIFRQQIAARGVSIFRRPRRVHHLGQSRERVETARQRWEILQAVGTSSDTYLELVPFGREGSVSRNACLALPFLPVNAFVA